MELVLAVLMKIVLSVLNYYSKTTQLRAIHSSETKQSVPVSKKLQENLKP